jgi:hypothetical protein
MFGNLDKRSGNLHVYQNRFFSREKNLLNYYAKQGDKKPRGSIDLANLSDIVLIIDSPAMTTIHVNGAEVQVPLQAAMMSRLSTFARPSKVNADMLQTTMNSAALANLQQQQVEFMLQVGNRNFILRAQDKLTRDAWIEELSVWIKVNVGGEDAIPIPKPTLRGLLRGIQFCIEHGAGIEGLFRVPGNKSVVEQICLGVYLFGEKYFEVGPTLDVLDVGSAIKKLLRDLPENIFTARVLPKLKAASSSDSVVKLLKSIPLENLHVLAKLAELFEKLCNHTQITKMNARNLAISIGPSVCETESTPLTLFETLINRRSEIFDSLTPLTDLYTNFSKFNISKTTTKRVSQTKKFRDEVEIEVEAKATISDQESKEYIELFQSLEFKDVVFLKNVDQILKSANDAADYFQKNTKIKWDEELDEDIDDDLKKEKLKTKILAARVAELEMLVMPPPPPPQD